MVSDATSAVRRAAGSLARPSAPARRSGRAAWGHQGRVKTSQGGVRGAVRAVGGVFREGMFEDLIAAVVGLALVVYLLYALVRPDRF